MDASVQQDGYEAGEQLQFLVRTNAGSTEAVESGQMIDDAFLAALQDETTNFTNAVATEDGDWIIKGFIDVYRRIYTISVDTKVISKVLELLLIPKLIQFGERLGYQLVLAPEQNFYPDLSFVSKTTGAMYAVDIKSTYRVGGGHQSGPRVNGMTLGAFTGYFRERQSSKNTTFPYSAYNAHIVLGVIYSKSEGNVSERDVHALEQLESISSVVRDFVFFAQPKYRIASARPGSGNTKNIGSVTTIDQLINGKGPFAELGEDIYDDYWMYYLTADMARAHDVLRPYHNLETYAEYKHRGAHLSRDLMQQLESQDTGPELNSGMQMNEEDEE